ncbi:hypothetical protein [Olivibacter sp. SDN3]|uniref:hypothetical protein n=1 Tax=Olivibacter sp. SDN3 TaxID=2764720 RepID=UPI002103E430|nr:hypothetical protein [Olivibacter sp. SDN3]
MITQVSSSLYHQLITVFEEGFTSKGEPDSLAETRRNAFARFKKTGFPSSKMEDWKYTNLQSVLNQNYLLHKTISQKRR